MHGFYQNVLCGFANAFHEFHNVDSCELLISYKFGFGMKDQL